MQVRKYFIIVMSFFALFVHGQTSGLQKCQQAEQEYRIGHFNEVLELLGGDLDGFSAQEKEAAYRLLSITYMEMDSTAQAQDNVLKLLRINPYYTTTINDPQRYIDMIESYKGGHATITTASQQAETPEEAPVPVTLITEQMIRDCGARNLQEVLCTYVPGMIAVEGAEANVAMRGIYTELQGKILVMLNGHRLNSHATNSEALDFRTSLDKVKQIEVLRGPSSSLYGNVALTAVVNIITKTGYDVDGIQVSGGYGSGEAYSASLLYGKRSVNTDITLWANLYSAKGEKRNVGVGDDDLYGYFVRPGYMYLGGYNKKPSFDLGMTAQYKDFKFLFNIQHSKKVMPYVSIMFLSLYDYDRYRLMDGNGPGRSRTAYHAGMSYEKTIGKWGIKGNVYADYEQHSIYDVVGDSIPVGYRSLPIMPDEIVAGIKLDTICDRGLYQNQSYSDRTLGLSMTGNRQFNFWGMPANLLLGMQYENYSLLDQKMIIGDHFDRVVVTVRSKYTALLTGTEENYSAFAQLKMHWTDKFIFNGGLRYDHKIRFDNRKKDVVSPRLALVYNFIPNHYLRLSYAHSFVDAPYYLRSSIIATYSGGNTLDYEGLDAWQFSYSGASPKLHLDYELNVFCNVVNNFTTAYRNVQQRYTNVAHLALWGVEGTVSYRHKRFRGNLNFTYQPIRNDTVNFSMPDFQLNATVACALLKSKRWGELSPWLSLKVQSTITTAVGGTYIYKGGEKYENLDTKIPSRILADIGVNYRWRKLMCSLAVYNLFDKKYYRTGYPWIPIPQQGRNIFGKIAIAID